MGFLEREGKPSSNRGVVKISTLTNNERQGKQKNFNEIFEKLGPQNSRAYNNHIRALDSQPGSLETGGGSHIRYHSTGNAFNAQGRPTGSQGSSQQQRTPLISKDNIIFNQALQRNNLISSPPHQNTIGGSMPQPSRQMNQNQQIHQIYATANS